MCELGLIDSSLTPLFVFVAPAMVGQHTVLSFLLVNRLFFLHHVIPCISPELFFFNQRN